MKTIIKNKISSFTIYLSCYIFDNKKLQNYYSNDHHDVQMSIFYASMGYMGLLYSKFYSILVHAMLCIQHSEMASHNFIPSISWSTFPPMFSYYSSYVLLLQSPYTFYTSVFLHSINMSKPFQSVPFYADSYAYQCYVISRLARRLFILWCHIT